MNEQFKNIQSYSFFSIQLQTGKKFQKNVFLHPIDCRYEYFQKYSRIDVDFKLSGLDSPDLEKRSVAKEIVLNFFKDAAQVSNSNLVWNANALLTKGNAKINADQEISWIGKSRKREKDKCRFTHYFFCLEKSKK